VPAGDPDDADRAARTAIAMQQAMVGMNEIRVAQGKTALAVGIGLQVGEVFAGNIGSDRRLEYTVIGDAVNTAARLCAEAGPGEILVGETFYHSLTAPLPATLLQPLRLKGKAQRVGVYRLDYPAIPTTTRNPM
jgi:adenylate cyclase